MVNLSSLNPQQRQAVETIKGPVLILAGAGTGKTRVITFRIAHMISRGISPENILAVTFTNKAAREMQQRVREVAPRRKSEDGEKELKATICTFHSLCVRILRQHIEKLGYKRNFVIYTESEQLAAVKKVLSHFSAKGDKVDASQVLSVLSRFKNGGAKALGSADPNTVALANHVKTRYDSALHACNAVDFDDLILLTLKLFREFPDALEACRAKYKYVMVDEYQDTNGAQFELVHFLTKEHRNFCVVGDDDQSIYGWRGAEAANIRDLELHFPEVKVVKLEQNYRSTNTILNAANAVIKNNANRRGKRLWSDKGSGEKIVMHAFINDEEEARTIVEEIEFNRMAKRVPWGEQAILFRTNLQARPIEMALRKGEVRYHLIGGQSFFDRREIKDFIAYLKAFVNPHDDISLLRIANVPARGLTDVTMERLLAASQERKCSVFTAMKNPMVQAIFQKRTQEAIQAFIDLIAQQHQQLVDNTEIVLSQWADTFMESVGYYTELKRGEKDQEVAESRIRNLKDLLPDLDTAGNSNWTPGAKVEAFLDDLALDNEREEEKEAGDAVTLITMHSCKGLEFPHVFVVGLEDGLLPHTRSKVEGTLDEERRLFYVAITRAMKSLTISHCETRKKYGQPMPCHPSPFLKELPADLIESADAKEPVKSDQGKNYFASIRAALG
ncbi:MAG TPA: UvrD-helicase domain-containing protein [Verrucomicrobiae bacterium]|nr:UvrD-helicase domain-containing protein [Verrucomicrobiae bacterium]